MSTATTPGAAATAAPDPMKLQGWVRRVAIQYRDRGVGLEDLISEGQVGLMKACQKFDPSRGVKFITYADYWIRQSIQRAIDNQARLIRVPCYVLEQTRAGKPPRRVRQAAQSRIVGDHCLEEGTLGEIVIDYRTSDPDACFARDDLVALMKCLTPTEALVVRLRYGLGGEEPQMFKRIGEHIGKSRTMAEWVHRDAMKKLREAAGVAEGVAA